MESKQENTFVQKAPINNSCIYACRGLAQMIKENCLVGLTLLEKRASAGDRK